MPLRVVVDTDVVVAAFASDRGASRQLLIAVLDGQVRLVVPTPLLIEYEAVLTRPAVRSMAGVAVFEVAEALDEIASVGTHVVFDCRWRPQARDPNDDLVLETAINGSAAVVASFNVADMQRGRHAGRRPAVWHRRRESRRCDEEDQGVSTFALWLPDDLQHAATAQAESAGLSLNEYILTALAARVGAQPEAERYSAARAARAVPGRALEILSRAGVGNPPLPGDELDEDVSK